MPRKCRRVNENLYTFKRKTVSFNSDVCVICRTNSEFNNHSK